MTDLTEQWKKGELEEGWYYIELNEPFDKIHKDISYYSLGSFDIEVDSNYIIEVLAPVPSYKEWQAKDKENQQLKERLLDMIDLLQKCYFYLNAVADGKVKTEHLEQIKTLAVLIDNAIGEK